MAGAVSVGETSPELVPLLGGTPVSAAGANVAIGDDDDDLILPAPATAGGAAAGHLAPSTALGEGDADADDEKEGGKKKKKKKKKDDDEVVDENGVVINLAQYGNQNDPSSGHYGALTPAQRKASKAVADILKTEMAAERTFFKWLWTGLHTGAIGSIIFAIFDSSSSSSSSPASLDTTRLVVIGFSWLVALALVLYGALVYYRRREALRRGDIAVVPWFTREHSPAVVVVALVAVVGVSMTYAIWRRGGADAADVDMNANTNTGGANGGSGTPLSPFALRFARRLSERWR